MSCIRVFVFCILSFTSVAFGQRPPLEKPYLVAPVVMDGRVRAEVWIFPREEKSQFMIEANPLMEFLRSQLKDDLWDRLRLQITPANVMSVTSLESAGFSVEFDQRSLELKLELPLRYRKSQELDLNYLQIGEQKFLRPNGHSGYLNIRSHQAYQYGTGEQQKLPLSGQIELVENVRGFVFETSADYLELSPHPWQRLDTTLRWDDEANMLRYSVGDLRISARGFQQAPLLAGFSVSREFSIQPYTTIRPLSSTEILLQRNSIVEIFVNGFLHSQLRLPPGVFNIRDFPLATGQNNIKVVVRDDLGRQEVYDFSLLFENTLLGKGRSELFYAVGSPWRTSGGDRAYEEKNLMTHFFHRWGLSDRLTLGLNHQSYKSQSLLGLEVSGVSHVGYLSFDGALSRNSDTSLGQLLTYRTLERMWGTDVPITFQLIFENRDERFTPVQQSEQFAKQLLRRYDGQLNWRGSDRWILGVGGGYLEMPDRDDQRLYRGNFIVPTTAGARFEVSYTKMVASTEEDRIMISFFWSEQLGRYSASAYYDTIQKSANVSLNRNNIYRYDDFRLAANLQSAQGTTTQGLTGEYFTQPAGLKFDHYSTNQGAVESHVTGVGINTGFAWIGTTGAFTQPITDSFVIVKTTGLPSTERLLINPVGDQAEAQIGPRSATVLRDLSAYYRYFVNIEFSSLSNGYLLEKEFYNVQPTYKSGILLDLNFKKQMVIKGVLVDLQGLAVSYVSGSVFNSKGVLVDNNFFTNKSGVFLIEGLEPGAYKLVLDLENDPSVTFVVAREADSAVDLGKIVVGKDEE